MTLVLLFGLLAGGAFAAKKYLLQRADVDGRAEAARRRGRCRRAVCEFKLAVEVTAASGRRLRRAPCRVDGRHSGGRRAPTWRALGLLNGELDLEAVGRQALNDSPAFYDPATKTIYVTDDLESYEHLYRFALHRALTAALLDQQFDWSARLATASPAAALAIRATIDGDALAVANALAADDDPDHLAPELLAFVQGHGNHGVAVAVRGDHRRPVRRGDASDDRPDGRRPGVHWRRSSRRPRAATRCSTRSLAERSSHRRPARRE